MACFTVCIPSYNAAGVIEETLQSLIDQTFVDWDCIVVDDGSTDGTEASVAQFTDPRIRFIKNEKNLGCPGNIQRCFDLADGTYIYLLGNDDILSPIALERTYAAFQASPDIGLVTRPYFWFEDDVNKPVRFTTPMDPAADRIISADDDEQSFLMLCSTLAQISALAFRRDAVVGRVSPYVFTTHVQLFLNVFKSHRAVFLKDYPVAVRIAHSQTRTISSIYEPSPLWSWVHMFETVFAEPRWSRPRNVGRNFVAKNVEGLVQIRCHSTFKNFLREAWLHLYYRPLNLCGWRWWGFTFACLLMPPRTLRRAVDYLMPFFMRPQTEAVTLAQ